MMNEKLGIRVSLEFEEDCIDLNFSTLALGLDTLWLWRVSLFVCLHCFVFPHGIYPYLICCIFSFHCLPPLE